MILSKSGFWNVFGVCLFVTFHYACKVEQCLGFFFFCLSVWFLLQLTIHFTNSILLCNICSDKSDR